MGGGLYDAAFATLGRLYGKDSRSSITGVTLLGGFASTVCWPISAYLVEHFGWRTACFTYAGVWLAGAVPPTPRNQAADYCCISAIKRKRPAAAYAVEEIRDSVLTSAASP
jgi:MFS family permease